MAPRRWELLDPPLFWRKLGLLVVFSALFLPLKALDMEWPILVYVGFLLLLHVYFVFVFLYRIRWRVLAQHRRSFALRLLAVALFIVLLAKLRTGASFEEFAAFLGVSVVIHTGLLLSLTVVQRPAAVPAVAAEA